MWRQSWTAAAVVAVVVVAAANPTSATAASSAEEEECGLYLALSSTSTADTSHWGVYTAKDLETGQAVGLPELAIHLLHLHTSALASSPRRLQKKAAVVDAQLEYIRQASWGPHATGGRFDVPEGAQYLALVQGVGLLGAGAPSQVHVNVAFNEPPAYRRVSMGEGDAGTAHASRGAISPHYETHLQATTKIPAGSEMFLWNQDNEQDGTFLVEDDFPKIDIIVDQLLDFYERRKDELEGDDAAQLEIYQFVTRSVMKAAVGPDKAQKITALLPDSPDELLQVKAAGGAKEFAKRVKPSRLSWLKEQGMCLDNLRPGPSTIPNAGRGAFATRTIQEGNRIAPMPLLQIPESHVLDMRPVKKSGQAYERASDEVIGHQLLVNYCLGHPESSLLLVPTGSMTGFINHADEPNAKLVWSNHSMHQKSWLTELEPQELLLPGNQFKGIVLEVVALRDIQAGEEVFIDYGPEWKAAWKQHVHSWKGRLERGELPNPWPWRGVDLNTIYQSDKPYPTQTEVEASGSPYHPPHVALAVFLYREMVGHRGTAADPYVWSKPPDRPFAATDLYASRIEGRTQDENGKYVYTVSLGADNHIAGVPHDAFGFIDVPEQVDSISTPQPFRHWIGIPDEIFPQGKWRNRGDKENNNE